MKKPEPGPETATMRIKQGIPVFYTGEPITVEMVNEVLEQIRLERERSFLGESKEITIVATCSPKFSSSAQHPQNLIFSLLGRVQRPGKH